MKGFRIRYGRQNEGDRETPPVQVQRLVNGRVVRAARRLGSRLRARLTQRGNQRLELRIDIVVVSAPRSSL